jgi:hypothetical protein
VTGDSQPKLYVFASPSKNLLKESPVQSLSELNAVGSRGLVKGSQLPSAEWVPQAPRPRASEYIEFPLTVFQTSSEQRTIRQLASLRLGSMKDEVVLIMQHVWC